MKKIDKNSYSELAIKKNRTFPVKNTIILVVCILVQVAAGLFALKYEPVPQDIIKQYNVTVEPQANGTLDIYYNFLWQAVDTTEELSWVDIGMANFEYTVDEAYFSPNIDYYEKVSEDGWSGLRLYFNRSYLGEDLEFSFKVNQGYMLCSGQSGYFYEFVPGWFNKIPVESYSFKWKNSTGVSYTEGGLLQNGYYEWSGALGCGEYRKMVVGYKPNFFYSPLTTQYAPFDGSGAYNELEDDKSGIGALAILVIVGIGIFEIYLFDCYVSYVRGRGFLTGYGHKIHTYGRHNPMYVRAYNRAHIYTGSKGYRGGGGGGCACACACACAGGGRAGCSQKDTYGNTSENH